MQTIIQNIVRFVVLVPVQVLVLNNIQFLGFINPYIYVLFILSLPVRTSRWLVLILSFVLGIAIDIFSNTLGLHAFACVLIAFLRGPFIKLFAGTEENVNYTPSFATFGISAYIKYVVFMVLTHHFTLYFLEVFSFAHFQDTLLRAFISSLTSMAVIFGIQVLKRP